MRGPVMLKQAVYIVTTVTYRVNSTCLIRVVSNMEGEMLNPAN